MKVGFWKIFDNSLVKYAISKRASWMHWKYFGLITKIKWSSGGQVSSTQSQDNFISKFSVCIIFIIKNNSKIGP